ncbi:MAG: sel1 repeat family protein [Alphaproteobacteria bacterium]|nr:sel1 repeat family protein [Alphaproteobacteria bacterium]
MDTVARDFRSAPSIGIEAYHRADYARAWTILPELARRGDPQAQYYLGAMYHFGQDTDPDPVAAVRGIDAPRKVVSPVRSAIWGVLYEDGLGLERDPAQAAIWYHRAAEQGNALAQHNLAMLYGAGRGVPEDDDEATRCRRSPSRCAAVSASVPIPTQRPPLLGFALPPVIHRAAPNTTGRCGSAIL